jgi:serine/threonine protein kinase
MGALTVAAVSLEHQGAPRHASMTEDIVPPDPQQIGDYRIEGRLGGGATGTVYRARRLALDLPVALKILSQQSDDPAFKSRFAQEARCAAAINHPNVVRVFDVGEHEGRPYLVAELVEGTSLGQLLTRNLILPVPEMVDICLQTLAALAALEDAGLVHRDVKPDNIMITRNRQVKLIDLGLVRQIRARVHQDGAPEAGQVMGTPSYMPPEQWTGGVVDHRADQFALGVTCYLAVTGAKPFPGDSPLAILAAMRKGNVVPIHRVNAQVSYSLSSVIMRMMAADVEHRWPNARLCARAISEAWAAQRPQQVSNSGATAHRVAEQPTTSLVDGTTTATPTPFPGMHITPARGTRAPTPSPVHATPRPDAPSTGTTSRITAASRTPSAGQASLDPLVVAERLQREGRIDEALALLKVSQTQEDPARGRQIRAVISGLHRIADEGRARELRQRLEDEERSNDPASLQIDIQRARQALHTFTNQAVRDGLARDLVVAERRLASRRRRRFGLEVLAVALIAALIVWLVWL